MKKIIAMVMALVMVMAIAVPAFAEPIGDTTVKVSGSSATSTYTVTIPAEINLDWNDLTKDGEYLITSQLEAGKVVMVSATVGTALTSANSDVINFTLTGDVTNVKAAKEVVNDEAHTITVNVEQSEWDNAPIADYTGAITFTAEVTTK